MRLGRRFRASSIILVSLTCFALAKDREWQTGKLLSSERERVYLGSSRSGSAQPDGAGGAYANSTSHARYGIANTYTIEGDKYVYIVGRTRKWRWNKEARVIENAPIKYAVDKDAIYLLDEAGREHKAKILRQILRNAGS